MKYLSNLMEWISEGLQGAEYLLLIITVSVLLSLVIRFFTGRKKNKLGRAEFIYNLMENIFKDKDVREFMFLVNVNEKWFSKEFFNDCERMKIVNKGLDFWNYVCYLEEQRMIPKKEYAIFESYILKIAGNISVQNYLYHLYHCSQKDNTVFMYYYLLDCCSEKMPGGFLDETSDNYIHV